LIPLAGTTLSEIQVWDMISDPPKIVQNFPTKTKSIDLLVFSPSGSSFGI
jgi:hypothetical protein